MNYRRPNFRRPISPPIDLNAEDKTIAVTSLDAIAPGGPLRLLQLQYLSYLVIREIAAFTNLYSLTRRPKVTGSPKSQFRLRHDGNDAVRVLVELAEHLCDGLGHGAADDPSDSFFATLREKLGSVAEWRETWPMLIGPHKDDLDRAYSLMAELRLGARNPFSAKRSGKGVLKNSERQKVLHRFLNEVLAFWRASDQERSAWNDALVAGVSFYNKYKTLPWPWRCEEEDEDEDDNQSSRRWSMIIPWWARWQKAAKNLKALDKDTVDEWFDVIWLFIEDAYLGKPEYEPENPFLWLPDLRPLGAKKEKNALKSQINAPDKYNWQIPRERLAARQKRCEQIDAKSLDEIEGGSALRNEIKHCLRKALRALVRREPKIGRNPVSETTATCGAKAGSTLNTSGF